MLIKKWTKEELGTYNVTVTDPLGQAGNDGPNNIILSSELRLSIESEKTCLNTNLFIVGSAGSGKSHSIIQPNIMQANTSYVITDPSGLLYRQYGRFLEGEGYRVRVFNLDHMDRGTRYNPFNYIRSNEDIELLAKTLISNTTPPEVMKGDPSWKKAESALLTALIGYLYHHAPKESQNFSHVMILLREADAVDKGEKSLLDKRFEAIDGGPQNNYVCQAYLAFKMLKEKARKEILKSLAVRLQMFNLLDVANLTETDDIDLCGIGDEKTALFIIIPTGDKTFNALAAMLQTQAMSALINYSESSAPFSQLVIDSAGRVWKTFRAENQGEVKNAREKAEAYLASAKKAGVFENKECRLFEIRDKDGEVLGCQRTKEEAEGALLMLKAGKVISNEKQGNGGWRLPLHTRFILDEFPNTGRLPGLPDKMSSLRLNEMSVFILVQSIQQLKNLYPDDWEVLTGNCDTWIYLGGGIDTATGEYLARRLQNKATNRPHLIKPDEIARALRSLSADELVVLMATKKAFQGKKFRLNEHPNFEAFNELREEERAIELSNKALMQYHAGESITVRCPKCDETPKVTQVDGDARLIVRCPCGFVRNMEINF